MSEKNVTTARLLMTTGGAAGKITGLSLSTVSTMYIMKYLLTAGCATVEYLPHLFNEASTVTLHDHFSTQMNASWQAVGSCAVVVLGGVIIRKLGNAISSDYSIQRMEWFMYGKPVDEDDQHED